MTKQTRTARFLGLILVGSIAHIQSSPGDVRLPGLFGDHMVLQQDLKIPVWGWADPGEDVTITLGDKSAKTTADASGKWQAHLDPVATTSAALSLTVTGKNTLKFEDVLVGDVWVCSGQSNMEFSIKGIPNNIADVSHCPDPQLRLFLVEHKIALNPETDVKGQWLVCAPASLIPFSAVGYYFGRELRHKLNRPIGLIGSYWGGTPGQSWLSLDALHKNPPFSGAIGNYQKVLANYPKAKEDYPAILAKYQDDLKTWNETVAPVYGPILKQWQTLTNQAHATGQPETPRPVPSSPMPKEPPVPEGPPNNSTVLFNGMIAPLMPYAIKGVIWYQGEANAGNGPEYQVLFPRLISDWREKWNQGDFPFLYVQLAAFGAPQSKPNTWARLREAQLKTLSLPNTGMAVTIDIGDINNVHPQDKVDVGKRLALVAEHVAYQQDVVYSGPLYDSMKIEGSQIRVTFTNAGAGLQMSVPPWTSTGVPTPAPTELTGFAIAGADKNWLPAQARIDGNSVIVSSSQVAVPVAVRYGWANYPECNLYNKDGLPASPFRTDDWDIASAPPAPPATPNKG